MIRRIVFGLLLAVNLFVLGTSLTPQSVSAASADACTTDGSADNFLSFPPWYRYLEPEWDGTECKISFDFTKPADYSAILLAILEIILRVGGIVAVVGIVYGGFQYITSVGEPDKAASGRTTIINSLVGMFIAMLASVIVRLIGRTL